PYPARRAAPPAGLPCPAHRAALLAACCPALPTLADPSGGPVLARSTTVLQCPVVRSGSLSGLHLPSFSTYLVSTTPGGQRVSICTCTRTGRHLATFTRRQGSSLYTLAIEPPHVAASAQVPALGPVAPPCSSLPPLLPLLAPPCLPCVEGRQRAAPHSSLFPATTAPLQTLHMDVGDEFSSDLLRDVCRGEGILQSFMLPASRQQNGIAERRIGFGMEVARTSMIHTVAPHFLWPFAVRYAAHQLNQYPRVSLPETSPTLRWTGKVGDASVFRVWGSCAFVRDTSADKLSARAVLCVFLGFPSDAHGWKFYHPTLRRVLPSQDITFNESVPFYHLFPYRSAPLPPPPLFLAPGPPPVDPLPPQGPAPSGVSQVDPLPGTVPVEVAVDSGAARGAASRGAERGVLSLRVRSLGVLSLRVPGLWSTGTYIDAVPPLWANIVDGMWIFRVMQPQGSPPDFKARYIAQGFSQRQGVDFFHTFSPTPKMTTLWVLLHVAAQRDYELHSLHFSTAFLQGSLHEEIWLRRPPGFTGSFPAGTQWNLWRPVYDLRQALREWRDTLRTTLAALGFAPSTADPSLFLRTDTSLPPFYVLVYVVDLVFATADTKALALLKSELQKRHTCTDLGELCNYFGLQTTQDRARHAITLIQSHMVHHVLRHFGFRYSSPQSTPLPTGHLLSAPPSYESVEPSGSYPELVGCLMYLMTCTRLDLAYPLSILARYVAPGRHRPEHWEAAKMVLCYLCSTSSMGLMLGGRGPIFLTGHEDASWVFQHFGFRYSSPESTPLPTGHSLSAPPSDESVEPSGSYPELVGCLIYLMTCTRPDLAYPLSILARYVAPGRHRQEHLEAAKRVLRYFCSTSGMGVVLGGRGPLVLSGHADASWVDDLATQRSSQGYTFSLGSGSVSWRSTRSSSVLSSSCEAEIYAGAMAAQELR
ncbi:unnamed protein product, partial [Closterium sp. NIES-54]